MTSCDVTEILHAAADELDVATGDGDVAAALESADELDVEAVVVGTDELSNKDDLHTMKNRNDGSADVTKPPRKSKQLPVFYHHVPTGSPLAFIALDIFQGANHTRG